MHNRVGRPFLRRLQIPTWIERGESDPYSDYAVYCSFNGPDAMQLPAYVPEKDAIGGGWSVIVGAAAQFKISSNQLWINLNTGSDGSLAIIDAGISDCVLTCIMTLAGNNPMLRVRVDGDHASPVDNHLIINPSVSANKLRIQKVQAGAWSTLAEVAQPYNFGDIISIRTTLLGTLIRAEDLTHEKLTQVNSAFNQTETEHGLGEGLGANGCKFDAFVIRYI
jgi:hypothetical protein